MTSACWKHFVARRFPKALFSQGLGTVSSLSGSAAKSLKFATKQCLNVSFNFDAADLPSGLGESGILIHQHVRDNTARVLPFINNLVEYSRIRMLRRKAQSKELDAHPGNLIDEERDIRE